MLDYVPQTHDVERRGWKLNLLRPPDEHVGPGARSSLLGSAWLGLDAERREAPPTRFGEEVAARHADLEQPAPGAAVGPHPAQAYAGLASALSAL